MLNLNVNQKNELKTTLLILLMIFPHFEPSHFNVSGSIIDNIYNILKILSTLFVFGCYVYFCFKNKYVSKLVVTLTIYCAYVVVNTFIQFGINRFNLVILISSVILAMVIDMFSKKHAKELVHGFLIMFELLIYVNFVLTLILNNIEESCHLLGNRNLMIVFITIALCLSLIWKNYKHNSLRFWILFGVCWVSLFIRGLSVTGLFSLTLFTLLYFTRVYKFKYFNLISILVVYFIFVILFVFLRIQNYMSDFFAAFGKSVTFSNRTVIWDKVMDLFMQSPIFGYGAVDNIEKGKLIGYAHSHNYLLEQLFQGGLLQVSIVVVFFVFVIKKMNIVKTNIYTKYLTLSLAAIFLHLVTESPDIPLYWVLFMFAGSAPEICQQLSDEG